MFAFLMAAATPGEARLVVIGDSLSDTGNAYAGSSGVTPLSPPYWQGRFSNGPVWVERLADALGLPAPAPYFDPAVGGGTNFAVGGAATGGTLTAGDMDSQVAALAIDPAFADLSDDLVVVWGGANDFFGDPSGADPADSVANLMAIVTELIGLGADSLLLANLPPLDQTPELEGSGVPAQAAAAAFALGFNTLYRAAVDELMVRIPLVDFLFFDVYSAMLDVIGDPSAYGFTNVTDPALTSSGVVPNPDEYLFWDGVHPTRAGHVELARIAASLVPAPPVLVLLLPGVILLLARRAAPAGAKAAG